MKYDFGNLTVIECGGGKILWHHSPSLNIFAALLIF
jgi:hypothetical protein